LDPHVDAILLRGLAKLPGERFPSARELGETLAEALSIPTRKMQPTLPDEHHRRAPWQVRPENHGLRTAAGGVAVGALLGIAALQLSNMLREPESTQGRESEPLASAHAPVAWLAEKPAPRHETGQLAGSARRAAHPPASADSAAPAKAAPDAGAPVDAGHESPDNVP
jgi:hypothetical protein